MLAPDLYEDYIKPAGVQGRLLDTQGPCTGESAYFVSSAHPMTISFQELENDLSGSYCLSLIADTNVMNTEPLLYFYDRQNSEIGSLTLVSDIITYTIRGESVKFFAETTVDFQHFQLCTNGSVVTFYDDCSATATAELSHEGFTRDDYITIFADNKETRTYGVNSLLLLLLIIFKALL